MRWTVTTGAVAQGAVRDALEAQRDEQAELEGFSAEEHQQQEACFAAAETLVDKGEFGGHHVSVMTQGRVGPDEGTDGEPPRTASAVVTEVSS